MESSKPAAELTKTSDRVNTRRPKRGYHTFKNGLLNVKPKRNEVELVRSNQGSPLLCLPPELRNKIWKDVLGGMAFQQEITGRRSYFRPSESGQKNCLALLRTCRQIYAETALLPYQLSTFSATRLRQFLSLFRKMKAVHRSQIADIQLEVYDSWRCVQETISLDRQLQRLNFTSLLPGLKHINVVNCSFNIVEMDEYEELWATHLKALNDKVEVTFTRDEDF